ncbi:MAG TPA: hypothetical protein VMR31_04430 [Myxococcota bacterium]|nr:hypothetical protein [Myxococcota bacterium]
MTQIYVNTDNSNAANKLYNAMKVGKSAAAAEKRMKQAVVDALSKVPDFQTDTPGKGYSIRMKVQAESAGRGTKYTIPVEIIRYPASAAKGGKGDEMVPTTSRPGSATVEGGSEADLLDALEALTQSNVKASLPVMRIDMTRR